MPFPQKVLYFFVLHISFWEIGPRTSGQILLPFDAKGCLIRTHYEQECASLILLSIRQHSI